MVNGVSTMFYKTKEIVVSLSPDEIEEKLLRLKRKSPFFQRIETDRFRIRINSNRPSLFRTSVSGILSGRIVCTDKININRIVYHSEPPIVFWVFFSAWLYGLFSFLVRMISVLVKGIPLDIHLNLCASFMLFLFVLLTFAEAVSQTNMSEERLLKAFEEETVICHGDKSL